MSSHINIISNSIIISSCLYGSIYLFSNSLIGLNKKLLTNKNIFLLDLVNGPILIFTGAIITITTYKALTLLK